MQALTEGKYSLEKREFFAILALHSHALSSTEGYKIGVVVNNGGTRSTSPSHAARADCIRVSIAACVIATTANRQFYNPVYALNLLKEAYEVCVCVCVYVCVCACVCARPRACVRLFARASVCACVHCVALVIVVTMQWCGVG